MKFVVELEDFYLEEGELKTELAAQIKNEVLHQIRTSIREQVNTAITETVTKEVQGTLKQTIEAYVMTTIETQQINSRYSKDAKILLKDYIKEMFEKEMTNAATSISDAVKKVSSSLVTEIKNRYDLMFASQIVAKMNDNGFLRGRCCKIIIR